jgi:DNA repair protein RadC
MNTKENHPVLDNNSKVIRSLNMVTLKMVREKKLGYNSPVTCSQDAIDLIRCLFQDSYREMVVVIGMDNSNRPTAVHTVSLGSPDNAAVSVSSIFKPLLLSNSTGFILVHNHPLCGAPHNGWLIMKLAAPQQ